MQRSRDPAEHKELTRRIAAFKRSVSLWDLRPGVPQARVLEQAGDNVKFSPDGRWLVTSGVDKVPRLWSLESGDAAAKQLHGHEAELEHVAFSADGRWFATGDYDGHVRLWDLRSNDIAQASLSLPAHSAALDGLAFSRDGRLLFSAESVATIVPLDQGQPGPAVTLPDGTPRLSDAVFTADGRWLVARDHDNNALTLWALDLDDLMGLACRTAGRDVSGEERRLYGVGAAGRPVCAARAGERQ
jgi:WD40 repeat protein